MSIKIEHVSHLYGEGEAFEKKALDDVTLEIPDGQFLGVIGHTGSGKSTLIQHLNGLLKATSGTIYYNNEDIYQENYDMKKLRSKVGLVFQYPEHQLFEIDDYAVLSTLAWNFFRCLLWTEKSGTAAGRDRSPRKRSSGACRAWTGFL